MSQHYQCPCCGYYTLDGRGHYEICPVCFWEDDAANEQFGHSIEDRPLGPNSVQLREARKNYMTFGASAERHKPHVRPPHPDEGVALTRGPEDVLHDLLELCPEFSRTWEDESYLWTDDSGIFTDCGAFTAFSHYIANVLTGTMLLGNSRSMFDPTRQLEMIRHDLKRGQYNSDNSPAVSSSDPRQLPEVFEYVERCMRGDEDVQTAAPTCFLENLMNRTPEQIDPQRFVPLLGPESRDYCRAWDEFCGVRTAGLW